jgi:hypothetical protein
VWTGLAGLVRSALPRSPPSPHLALQSICDDNDVPECFHGPEGARDVDAGAQGLVAATQKSPTFVAGLAA